LKRKKALLFIFDGYCEFEIASAISILRGTHELRTFSIVNSPCKSEAGITTIPDLIISEVNPLDYDVLIIPGGDLEPVANGEELFLLVKKFADLGKIIAAICSGVYIFAKAGVLKGRSFTVSLTKEQRDFLGCFQEENFQYKPVIISDNIVTAQGHAYVEFGIELAKKLTNVEERVVNFYRGFENSYMEKDDV
jgi:protein deglycase